MITLDYADRRPIYEQVMEKMKDLILLGVLETDSQLPSVRELAMDLSINPNTVQRAYAELERQGVIYCVKGRGNFVTLDVTTIRTNFSSEVACYFGIEEGSMEVSTHFTNDKAWPYILETYVLQALFEVRKEGVESSRVSQTTVHVLGTYLIRDRSDTIRLAEVLSVENEFYGALCHYVDVNNLTLWQEDIYGWIHVNQVVASQDSSLVTLFHALHSTLGVPTLLSLDIL